MKSLRMTRKQFAERLGIKQRRLDSWLLPVGSPELRGLDASTRLLIEKLLRREDLLANSRLVVVDQPCDVLPIVCSHGVKFPPIYRLTGYGHVFGDDGESILDGAVGELLPPAYLLSPTPTNKSLRQVACVERIARFDPAVDSGWLIVRRQRSLEALEGYMDAAIDVADELFDERFESTGAETPNGLN